jgi:fibronectin type 3 domain-containing protein
MKPLFLALALGVLSAGALPAQTPSTAIIADHRAVDGFVDIPPAYLAQVRQMLVYIAGESHSTAYGLGAELLAAQDARCPAASAMMNAVQSAGTLNPSYPTFDPQNPRLRVIRGYGGEAYWFANPQSTSLVPTHLARYNSQGVTAIGFGWCWDMTWTPYTPNMGTQRDPVYRVRWSGRSSGGPQGDRCWGLDTEDFAVTANTVNLDTYLTATQAYVDYCATNGLAIKPFFTTGPMDNIGDLDIAERSYSRELKHDRIRAWVTAHNGMLFDFADILSYNNASQPATSTWTDDLGATHSFPTFHPDNGVAAYGEYHFGQVGAVRVAKAMWWMLARLAGWDGLPSGTPDTQPPSVPASLAASVTSSRTISLTWGASDDDRGVASYRIYRATGAAALAQVATSTTASYSDSGLTASTTYRYAVSAVDGTGNASAQSAPISATTQQSPIRNAFIQIEAESFDSVTGNIQSEPCSEGGFNLGWITNGSSAVFNRVDFGTTAVSFSARVASASTGGQIAIHLDSATGPLVGTATVSGTGTWQTWDTVQCAVSGATGIHNLYLVFTGTGLFNLNWVVFTTTAPETVATPTFTPPAGTYAAAQSVAIATTTASATIRYTSDGSAPTTTTGTVYSAPVSVSATSTLRAIAYRSGYISSAVASAAYTIGPPDHLAPTVPTNLAATATSSTGISLAWTPSTDNVGVTGYRIYRTTGTTALAQVGTSTNPAYSDTGLTAFTAYRYTVDALDAAGNASAQSAVATASTLQLPTRNAFTQIEAETYDSATGAIHSESCAEGGLDIGWITNATYAVFIRVDFGTTAASFSARVASATTGGQIEVRLDSATGPLVGTATVSGTGSWQAWQTIQCSVSGATGIHNLYLVFTGTSGGLYNLNWFIFATTPADTVATPAFTPAAGTFTAAQSVAITTTTASATIRYTTDGSTPTSTTGTVYSAAVSVSATSTLRAIAYRSGYINSAVASAAYTINTADTQPPTVPTNLAASATSSSTVSLTWAASTDAVGVTGYRIYRNATQIATAATNSYSDSGLTAATQYAYRVAAYDAAGNLSAQCTAVNVTPLLPSLISILPWKDGRRSALCFGFDDGGGTNGDAIMTARGLNCYFSINSNWPRVSGNWALWNTMVQHGHELSSHSSDHFDLGTYYSPTTGPGANYQDYLDNVRNGVIAIEANIPRYKVLTALNPSSAGNNDQRRLLESLGVISVDQSAGPYSQTCVRGYSHGFTYDMALHPDAQDPNPYFGINRVGCDNRSIEAIQAIVATNIGGVTNLFWHGIQAGQITEANFATLMDWLKAQQDSGELWVGRYGDIIRYMKQRLAANLQTVSTGASEMEFSLSDSLPDEVYNIPLTLEVQVPSSWSASELAVVQADATTAVRASQSNGLFYIRFNAVPDRGNIKVEVVIPDTTAPSVPTNLVGGSTSISAVNLSWAASTDSVGVAGYRIYDATGALVGVSETLSYELTGLAPGTVYTFTVSAFDAAGNESPLSAPVSVLAHDPAMTTYTAWRSESFAGSDLSNDAISGPAADPDGAGVSNFQRYAHGLAARGPVANPVTLGTIDSAGQRYLTLSFVRRAAAAGLSYSIEASPDLVTWTPVPGLTYTAGTPASVTAQDTVAMGAPGAARRFLRLRLHVSP